MKWVLIVLGIIVLGLVGFGVYVRLSPNDPARWNVDPQQGVASMNSAVERVVLPMPPAEALAAFDAVAMAEPRTVRLAGSIEEGRITYVSRSRLWGFPDFTTVAAVPEGEGTALVIWGRARFGDSDWGVNAARIGRWVAALRS